MISKFRKIARYNKIQKAIYDFISAVVQVLVIAGLFRTFLYEPYKIPTGSMYPNLMIGDHVFVEKFAYGYGKYSAFGLPIATNGRLWFHPPERGDIIVFRHTKDTSTNYVKRVIGLPGDRIVILGQQIYVNTIPIKREPVPIATVGTLHGINTEESSKLVAFRESLPNGKDYVVLQKIDALHNHGESAVEYIVPLGHYFFMGDNRDNSADSRFELGFVPEENLIGRAKFLFWTSDMMHSLIYHHNSGRALHAVK